jgi:putative transcriptional regulator
MTKRECYHYTMCGLDNVYLENGYEIHQTPQGRGVSIEHADILDKAIARAIVYGTSPLTGKEFRFLRSQLDKTQLEIAGLFGTDTQTVARWEKGENVANPAADRLIRILYLQDVEQNHSLDIDRFMWRLSEDSQKKSAKLVLKTDHNGDWTPVLGGRATAR